MRPGGDRRPLATVAVCAAALTICLSASPLLGDDAVRRTRPIVVVTPDESWNAVFDRQDGWTGADGAGSVDLGDGRILWLFGDTWIGSIRAGRRLPGAWMVNNSIAVHPKHQSSPWIPPAPAEVRFLWGPQDAVRHPTAWIAPASPKPVDKSASENGDWFWPAGGGLCVAGPANSRRLFLFFFRVRRKAHGEGVWNFSVIGTTLGTIDNAAEPAERWRVRLQDVPYSIAAKSPPGTPQTPAGTPETELTWGMTVCLRPFAAGESPEALIYGVRQRPLNSALVLARAPAAQINHFDRWRFYAGKNSWSSSASDLAGIANGLVAEFSIEPITDKGKPTFLLTQSEPFLGRRIFVRTADDLERPWSLRRSIYSVPDVSRNRSYFTYAAKSHLALSRPGEALVTYLVNSSQFADVVTDTQIYRPKFIRIPQSLLPSP